MHDRAVCRAPVCCAHARLSGAGPVQPRSNPELRSAGPRFAAQRLELLSLPGACLSMTRLCMADGDPSVNGRPIPRTSSAPSALPLPWTSRAKALSCEASSAPKTLRISRPCGCAKMASPRSPLRWNLPLLQDRQIKGTTDWTDYSISVPVNDKADQLYVGFLFSGSGKA